MAYSDALDMLDQIKMTNMNLIRSQIPPVKGDLVAQDRKDRDDARNKKKNKINLRKQQDQIKADEAKNLKDASDYYRGKDPNAKIYNRDGQEVLNDGSIIRDEDIRTDGPIIDPNTLLQIGGAAGGLLRLLINPFGGKQLAKLPPTPPTEKIMLPNGKMIDSPLRFKTDEQRERFMQDFSKGFGRYS